MMLSEDKMLVSKAIGANKSELKNQLRKVKYKCSVTLAFLIRTGLWAWL